MKENRKLKGPKAGSGYVLSHPAAAATMRIRILLVIQPPLRTRMEAAKLSKPLRTNYVTLE